MDTRNHILNVAEQLFSEQSLSRTSLRAITAAAQVNLAAVHYHFGSKEALVYAIFERRLKPMNAERLHRLDTLEVQYRPVPLAALIRSFVAPPLELSRDRAHGGEHFIRLLGRTYTEPTEFLQDHVRTLYESVSDRYQAAFNATLPELDPRELYWRLHFMVGTLAYCMSGPNTMRLIASSHLTEDDNTPALIERLTRFLIGGLNPAAALAD